MQRAWTSCAELVLDNVRVLGDLDPDAPGDAEALRTYGETLKRLVTDAAVGAELLKPLQDENEYVRSAALSALARGLPDRAARVLLSRYLNGFAPFLDPREPIPADHLRKGAKRLGMDEPAARDLLASCEDALGWNPLEGGRP